MKLKKFKFSKKMNQKTPKKLKKDSTKKISATLNLLIITFLIKSTDQQNAKKVNLDTGASSTILTLLTNDEILTWSTSKSNLLVVTKQGYIYTKPFTSPDTEKTNLNISRIDSKILPASQIFNLNATADCWINEEKCVVCGIGGCYTILISKNLQNIDKFYFNKKFLNNNIRDFNFAVLALDYTSYFFTAQSFYSDGSGGIVRYNSNSLNCYTNWSPKLKSQLSSLPVYILKRLKYTKYISAVIKNTGNLFIIDYTTLKNTSTAIVNDKKFGSLVENFQDFDYIDGAYKNTAGFVVCGTNPSKICSHVILPIVNTPTQPKDPAVVAIFSVDNPTVKVPAQTPVPTVVRVKAIPESSKHFVVSYGKHLYFYGTEIISTIPPSGPGKANVVAAYGEIEGKNYIIGIKDAINLSKFIYSTNTSIFSTSFVLKTGLTIKECFLGCGGDKLVNTCGTSFFRSQGCIQDVLTCKNTGNQEKYKPSEFPQGAKCVLDFQSAYKPTVLGGQGSWNEKPSELKFTSEGQVCVNATFSSSSGNGSNPNDGLKGRDSQTSGDTGGTNLTVLFVILGVVGGLVLVGLILFLITRGGGKNSPGIGKMTKSEMQMMRNFMKRQILENNMNFMGYQVNMGGSNQNNQRKNMQNFENGNNRFEDIEEEEGEGRVRKENNRNRKDEYLEYEEEVYEVDESVDTPFGA